MARQIMRNSGWLYHACRGAETDGDCNECEAEHGDPCWWPSINAAIPPLTLLSELFNNLNDAFVAVTDDVAARHVEIAKDRILMALECERDAQTEEMK